MLKIFLVQKGCGGVETNNVLSSLLWVSVCSQTKEGGGYSLMYYIIIIYPQNYTVLDFLYTVLYNVLYSISFFFEWCGCAIACNMTHKIPVQNQIKASKITNNPQCDCTCTQVLSHDKTRWWYWLASSVYPTPCDCSLLDRLEGIFSTNGQKVVNSLAHQQWTKYNG